MKNERKTRGAAVQLLLVVLVYLCVYLMGPRLRIGSAAPPSEAASRTGDSLAERPAPARRPPQHSARPRMGEPRPRLRVLPGRVISVFGLESSGTTFLAETLSSALQAKSVAAFNDDLHYRNADATVEVQHISEPWGHGMPAGTDGLETVEFVAPEGCMIHPDQYWLLRKKVVPPKAHPACSVETGLEERLRYPRRFFVNITSHIEWYRSKGVEATAILVVRDDTVHFRGKLKKNERNQTKALSEDEHGKRLMLEALDRLPPSQRLIVSYEALMAWKGPYLMHLYKVLGINSVYLPQFRDGNAKYTIQKIALNGKRRTSRSRISWSQQE